MEQLERWRKRLSNLTVSPLTRDYPEPSHSAHELAPRPIEACETLRISEDAQNSLQQLQDINDRHHSVFSVLLSALVVLLSRLTGDEDIAIGTSHENQIPFVLRIAIDPKTSFSKLLTDVEKLSSEYSSDAMPLDDLRHHLKQSILYRVGFYSSLDTSQETIFTLNATDLIICFSNDYYVKPGLSNGTNGTDYKNAPSLKAIYNQRIFSSARVSFILAQLLQIVQSAAANPNLSVSRLDLMTKAQRTILPDPGKDLHWDKFGGAIHDIFSANAERHPERLCVVETASSSSAYREFNYRQIHWASNIVAHHLIESGVQRGEVVMIYAYRGVDLVVAVMGVLKAGGTFSVIDPLYPPDRQIIYLTVAQPRALINLRKATLEAGQLSENVRSFITKHLQLRVEIPSLFLRDDGTVFGGDANGEDIFSHLRELESKPTNIVIGPDDIPTLSFTSGSEGIPKGVRGRHFSLAYYFPWMAQRFNLGAQDRITMLSGIAHDPIQRDIFTPLFLGAQILVPSKDDIQYERLAEWMEKYGATVTHLTPAMGQILVGNASAEFTQLHHAFFVGDVLIKRDCKALQRLAPNVRIVNMYGTTETQRAVSYYEIPSFNDDSTYLENMKDVIPAGKGMSEDVQLLVVNRADPTKLCGIGEVGEIYVRAGGLAEGYLGQKQLSEKKFKFNWLIDSRKWIMRDEKQKTDSYREPWREFFLGSRDRLYRSGDLGRYAPSGDVECSGRADDQVKIRGFRIELGEIDTHLSKHALVRENVTLVRRDKDEEPSVVSYIVPEMTAWLEYVTTKGIKDEPDAEGMVGMLRRFQPLREEVREYLKSKLPAYSVPSTIIPLKRLPLNPNGKVDKPALPFPDISELAASAPRRTSQSASTLSETEKSLASIWAQLLRIASRTIGAHDSFFDLGGDSLKANQMIFEVRKTWRVEVGMNTVFRSPKLQDFALSIDKLRDTAAFESSLGDQNNDLLHAKSEEQDEDYAADARRLEKSLSEHYPSVENLDLSKPITVFLTGATGFLGSYILRDLLSRKINIKVIAHVRSKSAASSLQRVKETCGAYGFRSESWGSRLRCVAGNLGDPKLGLQKEIWDELSESVDIVIHNGALVHWVYPYSKLKGPNVQGTIDAMGLCAIGKPKSFVFVSSTSVLDNDYYVQLSDRLCSEGKAGISESDDLEGSRTGLNIGYGQVKWVSEYLTREAGRRGLRGAIVRPGYISGDSQTGVTNVDDFLIRMLKGCIQLSAQPDISNTINMCPVDFVARLIVAAAIHLNPSLEVIQCASHPRLRFNEYLGMLRTCGYNVPKVDYIPWRTSLERYVAQENQDKETQHALLPLYHFVTADLPTSTKSPELDDSNAIAALRADSDKTTSNADWTRGSAVGIEVMKKYVAWLVAIGFLPSPQEKQLQGVEISEKQKEALGRVGGRGGTG